MQDMTSDICTSAKENDTTTLIDSRDGNSYWVAKLKDDNCWMTQNLAYNPPEAIASNPTNWGEDNTASKYYNPGKYIYTTPTTTNNCTVAALSLCTTTSYKWQEVSALTASDNPNFYKDNSNSTVNNEYYDSHFLSGNYYSWLAATTGTGSSISSGNATGSICPKGWQLPTSNSTTASKSFGYLLTQYGLQSNVSANGNDLRLAPLYFVYGGRVTSSSLELAGSNGYYWSSTASSSTNAYRLAFETGVYPSDSNIRYRGYSVRCVAR